MAEKVIYELLKTDTALIAEVPQDRIFGSVLPLKTTLPAIAYNAISGTLDTSIGLTNVKSRSRIQVTIAANDYPTVKRVLGLVSDACNNKQGTFNGVVTDSVLKSLVGPDFRDDDENIFYQTVDFYITYTE